MKEKSRVGVVIAARNEEGSILPVLASLDGQSLRPVAVVVVDDGSTDRTPEILREAVGCMSLRLSVVPLPAHEGSRVGKPELALVFNAGLRVLRSDPQGFDFVMILGGDHRLPRRYLESVTERMQEDPSLAVAAGWIAGEPYWEHAPRGSGMVIRARFWEAAGGLQFPANYGWESWLYLKAQQSGYRTRSFKDLPTAVSRRTSMNKGVPYGRAMYALGYYWPYAFGRCLLVGLRTPRGAVEMLSGFLGHEGVVHLDVADWVGRSQRRVIVRRASHIILRLGRR